MFYREAGQFKATYQEDSQIFPIRQDRIVFGFILALAFLGVPALAQLGFISNYTFTAILTPFLIFALAAFYDYAIRAGGFLLSCIELFARINITNLN